MNEQQVGELREDLKGLLARYGAIQTVVVKLIGDNQVSISAQIRDRRLDSSHEIPRYQDAKE